MHVDAVQKRMQFAQKLLDLVSLAVFVARHWNALPFDRPVEPFQFSREVHVGHEVPPLLERLPGFDDPATQAGRSQPPGNSTEKVPHAALRTICSASTAATSRRRHRANAAGISAQPFGFVRGCGEAAHTWQKHHPKLAALQACRSASDAMCPHDSR
jgi:hypothetical protein